jgi:hypothetical protein
VSSNVIPVARPRQVILCAICGDNEAHYVSLHGDLVCGLCPIKHGIESISFTNVGQLLLWSRRILEGGFMNGDSFGELRAIVGRVLPEKL